MAKGRYAVVGGAARKVKKRYAVIGGVTRKIKKRYAVVGGVTKLIWSGGGDANPYVWYFYRPTGVVYKSVKGTAENFSGPWAFESPVTVNMSIAYIRYMTYFAEKYFAIDDVGKVLYSVDGSTFTLLTTLKNALSSSVPVVVNGKLCFSAYSNGSNGVIELFIIDKDLNCSTKTITYPHLVNYNAHVYIPKSLQYLKSTGKYYFLGHYTYSSGGPYGSGGQGAYRLYSVDSLESNATVTDLGQITNYSYSSSSSGTSGYADNFVKFTEQDNKLLLFCSCYAHLYDPVSGVATKLQGDTSGSVYAVYRISDNEFFGFLNGKDAVYYTYSNGTMSRTKAAGEYEFWYYGVGGQGTYYGRIYPGYGGSGNYRYCGGIGHEGGIYYATYCKKNGYHQMILYYSLNKGATWTENTVTVDATAQVSTSTLSIRFSKSIEIENEILDYTY